MIKKMICYSDVDGTIYGRDFKVSSETKDDILKFIKNGGEFVISTGNPAFERHQNLADELSIRYLITSNGAGIFDNKEKKYIYLNPFPIEIQEKIFNLAKKYNAQVNFWNDKNYFSFNSKEEYNYSYDYSLYSRDQVINSSQSEKNVVKIEVFGNENDILVIYNEIKNLPINVVFMRKNHLEITNFGSSKGNAAKWFSQNLYDEDVKNAMTIGDSPNDWSMLEISDFSYAMENGTDQTREKSKFYTATCMQNGVGLALRDYMDRVKSKNNSNS
ncbi:Cof-type HAD-IIB family hydrolase [Mycoplasma sp. AC157]|uniref:Cof-type HAD-IIB family hydrolase n=1 Tax=Mycoplasma sp. 480 TaxID=3440155 RepID=UPI003F511D5D